MKRVLLVFALLVALAGCGAGSGSSPADPAKIAPPSTLAYATLDIAPQGDAATAFTKLLGPDPQAQLGEAFTHAAQTSGSLDYATDVKPWLGDTLSVVVTRVGRRSADFAVLAASTDDDKARAAIDKDLAGAHPQSATYRDVDYTVLEDGTANGVVAHFLVAGTEPAFKAVVDASKDGKSLADSDQWKSSVGDRGDGKEGLAYVDVKGLLQSFASDLPGAERLAAPLMLAMVQLHPFVGTLDAKSDAFIGDLSSPGTKADPNGPGAASSPLIESLPAEAWLGAAVPNVGQMLGKLVAALKANPLIGSQYAKARAAVKARSGVDLQSIPPAVDDVAAFALGTTPKTVGGGVVVTSQHPAALARLTRRLSALITHAGGKVKVRRTATGMVAASSASALRAAVQPTAKLGDSDTFKKAASLLGGRPTLFVNFGPALDLAAASPHHKNDAHFQRALPHLRHIEYLAAGARRDGDLDVLRGVVGLR